MLAGSKEFIQRAVRARKVLGGGMRQAGILAAAGKIALLDMMARLEVDHRNARTFARGDVSSSKPVTVTLNTCIHTASRHTLPVQDLVISCFLLVPP